MTRDEFEAALRKVHGATPIARVPMRAGRFAYVRRPSADEYMALQIAVDGAEGEVKQRAYAEYVKACFAGGFDPTDARELTFAEVEAFDGPAFVRGGALGLAVNVLAGSGSAPPTFL